MHRRDFLTTTLAGAGATALFPSEFTSAQTRVPPVGLPMGEYLSPLDDTRFFFRQYRADLISQLGEATADALTSPSGQLALRLGGSAGFSVGFLSTVGFLQKYRRLSAHDYRHLYESICSLPKALAAEKRRDIILSLLANHRAFAATLEPGNSARKRATLKPLPKPHADDRIAYLFDTETEKQSGGLFCNNLERLSDTALVKTIVNAHSEPIR